MEKKLLDSELINFLEHNGITQEINRTFLHPLGLELRINSDTDKIEFWQTDDPKGYVLNKVNKMYSQVFRKFASRKNEERTKLLGFGIQVKDLFRSENMHEDGLLMPPERLKIEAIISALTEFTHQMYVTFIQNHKEKDNNFSPNQFDYNYLITKLTNHFIDSNWVNVANYSMLLNQEENLKSEMKTIEEKAAEFKYYMDEQKKLTKEEN